MFFALTSDLLQQADYIILDLQTKQLAKRLTGDIVIITIDDYSLSKM